MVLIGEKPWAKVAEMSNNYGRIIVEPLERGFGATLGNSLRRILLSSLPGAAITAVKIEGIDHEFSTISGASEDVLHIILNLKEVIFKSHSEQPKIVTLTYKGKGEAVAGEIEHDSEIEIINPEHKIATLEGGKLEMEMMVERGRGFVAAENNKKPNQALGYIPIDSIFSPVLKVNITTEEIRVGPEIKYDRLILDVWTNGSIAPDEAVRESAKILSRSVDLFLHLGEKAEEAELVERKEAVPESALEMNLEDLELSSRALNCLKEANIKTVADLLDYPEKKLMKLKNFGAKSLSEVKEKLAEYKLTLKGEENEAP